MCGITALFSQAGDVDLNLVSRANSLVRHRGPDDSGGVVFGPSSNGPRLGPVMGPGTVAFAHNRLSIIDLSALGHQPMSYADDRYWIVYNGEIYNYQELREELKAIGFGFVSQSDTEVILAAFAHWGARCLDHLNGMFAFVILDTHASRVFAARDRFGVKPLYYWRSPHGLLALASEIKQFTVLPGWQSQLNGQRAYDFLNWGLTDHTDETLFSGVRQLRGGECVGASVSDLEREFPVRRWYTLEGRPCVGSLDEAAGEFAALFEDSVRLRLRADVLVGSCLSGGLDSSSIVCVANRLLRAKANASRQHSFSARSSEPRYDEGQYISEIVRHTGVTAHETTPPLAGLFNALPQITWHQDEPFGSTSIYAQWHVFKLASENGVKVMLDGQGADELLAGYHGFFGHRMANLLRHGQLLQVYAEIRAVQALHGHSPAHSLKIMADILLPNALRQVLRRLIGKPAASANAWLNMERLGAGAGDPFLAAGARTDSIQGLSAAHLLKTNLPMLLHWEDRDSMAHGVESRVPFLDYRLVEFALGLPDEYKLRRGITKRVLRESMRGILPELVRERVDKLGFATPEEVWMRQQAPDVFRAALASAVDSSRGVVRPVVLADFEDVLAGRRPFTFLPWRLISFGSWMDRFAVAN